MAVDLKSPRVLVHYLPRVPTGEQLAESVTKSITALYLAASDQLVALDPTSLDVRVQAYVNEVTGQPRLGVRVALRPSRN